MPFNVITKGLNVFVTLFKANLKVILEMPTKIFSLKDELSRLFEHEPRHIYHFSLSTNNNTLNDEKDVKIGH